MDQGQGGEKRRLEQFLLQSRASNVIMIDPTVKSLVNRFEPQNIDRLRLFESQRLAGKVDISEKLKKAQKKKKKKAKKSKALRGDLSRNLTEIRRSEKGERRDKDTEEPRIVGDPAPPPAGAGGGFAYDPVIETRRLDLQEALADQRRIEGIADRAAEERRFQTEIALRRGELAGARADRRALGARADADPIPEIIRLGDRLRGDYDAFGREQDRANREVLGEVREQINLQERRTREEIEAIIGRQQAQDENIRDDIARQDARFREIHDRLGAGEDYLSEGREQVIQEIRAAEERLRGAQRDLDRPTSYDEVLLAADRPRPSQSQRQIEEPVEEEPLRLSPRLTPSPSSRFQEINEPVPEEPSGAVVEGGGELELPSIVVAAQQRIEPRSPSPRASGGSRSPLVGGGSGETAAERLERLFGPSSSSTQSSEPLSLGIPEERLRRGGGRGTGQYSSEESASSIEDLEEAEQAGDLSPREALRLGRLAVEEAAEEEAQEVAEVPQARMRLVDTQDFLGGFDRPAEELAGDIEILPLLGGSPVSGEESSAEGTPVEFLPGAEVNPRPLRPQDEAAGEVDFLNPDEVGLVQDRTQSNIEDSKRTYEGSFTHLSSEVRPGPSGPRGSKRGKGYRIRNNTDRTYKKIEPGDVVDVIGSQAGNQGQGAYVLDTGSATGSQVGLPSLKPLIDDGSLIFERGHRHELGGHFEEEPYGPPPAEPQTPQQRAEEQESEELQAQIREGEEDED